MKLRRRLVGPDHAGGPSKGRDVVAVKRGLHKVEDRFFPRPPGGYDTRYNRKTEDAVQVFQRLNDIPATGRFNQATLDALWPYMDAYARLLYRTYRPPREVPDLGPVWAGGKSVLDHDLTHATSGIPLYPAFDDAFVEGREIIAPEEMEVTRTSSSRPGLAFYAEGDSRIQYWFGHLDRMHPAGRTFERGELVGKVAANAIGGGPHVHVGINVELLLGKGKELIHHTNYTHGAATVRAQLEKALG